MKHLNFKDKEYFRHPSRKKNHLQGVKKNQAGIDFTIVTVEGNGVVSTKF